MLRVAAILIALALPCRGDDAVHKWIEPRRVEWRGTFWEEWGARYYVVERHSDWWIWGSREWFSIREVTAAEFSETEVVGDEDGEP
jgi:hypothetical protein